jgi:hypothetical protein
MNDPIVAARTQLSRQIAHWTIAVARLQTLEDLAAAAAWNSLERYLGMSIRQHLNGVLHRLKAQTSLVQAALDAASSSSELEAVRRHLLRLRRRYLRAEVTLDFFADAINSRTSPTICGLLNACDTIAYRSMAQALDQLGKPTPAVLTYLDKGLGASILKAGLRLWDGGIENPAAAIKIVFHNLHRPTALIHESGHQFAHIVGWNEELAAELASGLNDSPAGINRVWAGWASEIAADGYAFAHTGYASVAALHDVVAGDESGVFGHTPGDPHPISYLRVLLGVEMCREFYGSGPWDDLALSWIRQYTLERATPKTQSLLRLSLPWLRQVAYLTLRKSMRAFGGRSLSELVDPRRVSIEALDELERRLGPALYTSMHWIWTESLRLLALTSLKVAIAPGQAMDVMRQQEAWMLRLGGAAQAA